MKRQTKVSSTRTRLPDDSAGSRSNPHAGGLAVQQCRLIVAIVCSLMVGSSTANDKPAEPTNSSIQTRYRRPDNRVVVNSNRLTSSNIRRYESKRLILYTDIDNQQLASQLPKLADALFDHLTKYFGPLPPAKNGGEFQATGYLMKDQKSFRTKGLLTNRVPHFENGRHLDYEFWVNDQEYDYYKRHLVLHEFVHTFMTCVTGPRDAPAPWYMEGMAEYFAAHRMTKTGVDFGVMPENLRDYEGFRRIRTLRQSIVNGNTKSMAAVMQSDPARQAIYSWGWAACWFFAEHPKYGPEFRKLGCHLSSAQFMSRLQLAIDDKQLLEIRWHEFVNQVCESYDLTRAAIPSMECKPLKVGATTSVKLRADRGWQPTGVLLDYDGSYKIEANGRFQVHDEPKPWISEPNGVSIQYVRGERLGCVLGAIVDLKDRTSLSKVRRIGEQAEIKGASGSLYLRINDTMDSLANNAGSATVEITRTR